MKDIGLTGQGSIGAFDEYRELTPDGENNMYAVHQNGAVFRNGEPVEDPDEIPDILRQEYGEIGVQLHPPTSDEHPPAYARS